jgi:hypothetical protein
MACEIYLQKLENASILVLFQRLILGTPFDESLPFFQHVLQGNVKKRVQNIYVCKIWKVNFI